MLFRFCLYGFLKNLRVFDAFLLLALRDRGLDFAAIGALVSVREVAVLLLECLPPRRCLPAQPSSLLRAGTRLMLYVGSRHEGAGRHQEHTEHHKRAFFGSGVRFLSPTANQRPFIYIRSVI